MIASTGELRGTLGVAKAVAYEQTMIAFKSALTAASKASAAAEEFRSGPQSTRIEAGNKLLLDAKQSYQQATNNAQRVQACPNGRRVYPHAADATDLAGSGQLAAALRTAGFVVPAAQYIPANKMPRQTELRYFRKDEEGGAIEVTRVLSQAGLISVRPRYVTGYETSTQIRPCHYELWIAPLRKGPGSD